MNEEYEVTPLVLSVLSNLEKVPSLNLIPEKSDKGLDLNGNKRDGSTIYNLRITLRKGIEKIKYNY